MKNLLLFIVFLLAIFTLNAQNNFCGTVDDGSMIKRLEENKKAFRAGISSRDDLEWLFIPIEFHIVTKSDGTGGIDEDKILDELAHVNNNYASFKMKFYLADDFNYIKSNSLFSEPGSTFGVSKIKVNKKKFKNAVNVFIVDNIESGAGPGRVLGYYKPNLDVLVIRKTQFGVKKQTVSHELGHFFSLLHPFYGWEPDPYDPAKHGNPVKIITVTYEDKTIQVELMDKSNCEVAADKLCDTPPDYNFGITDPEQDCKLNGPILDHNHDTIVTMENNYMGYFFGCGDYEFTPMQIASMRADFLSNKRNFLHSDYVPDTTAINKSDFSIIYPANGEKVEFYDYVDLDWSDVPNATQYEVVVAPPSQPQNIQKLWVKGQSHVVVKNLIKGKKYKWYVRPFSNAYTAIPKLGGYTFKAGDWTLKNSETHVSSEFDIYPNPVDNGILYIKSSNSYDNAVIEIFDMTGKIMYRAEIDLSKGVNKLNLTHSNYQNAMYNIVIKTKDHKYIRKVFVEK